MLQLARAVLKSSTDKTKLALLYANQVRFHVHFVAEYIKAGLFVLLVIQLFAFNWSALDTDAQRSKNRHTRTVRK